MPTFGIHILYIFFSGRLQASCGLKGGLGPDWSISGSGGLVFSVSYLESRETSGRLSFLNLFVEPEVWICKIKDASLEAEASLGFVPLPCLWKRGPASPSPRDCVRMPEPTEALPHLSSAHFTDGEMEAERGPATSPQVRAAMLGSTPRAGCHLAVIGSPGTLTSELLCVWKAPTRVVRESSLRSSGLGGMWVRRGTRPRSPSW